MGGSKEARKQADQDLQQCVEKLGEKELSNIMHLGVKIGGAPVFPTWYRWGYGWSYSRGYQTLTDDELKQVNSRLVELRDLIDATIKQQQTTSSNQ